MGVEGKRMWVLAFCVTVAFVLVGRYQPQLNIRGRIKPIGKTVLIEGTSDSGGGWKIEVKPETPGRKDRRQRPPRMSNQSGIAAIRAKGQKSVLESSTRMEKRASTNPLIPFPQVDPVKMKTFYFTKYAGRCLYYCQRFHAKGWKRSGKKSEAHIATTFQLSSFKQKYFSPNKNLLNLLDNGAYCLGSSKSKELITRSNFAKKDGCNVADLKVQPPQWNMVDKSECEHFLEFAKRQENKDTIWILKPTLSYHGEGISLSKNITEIEERYKCGEARYVVQKYIHDPALMGGHKFDMRTYLLIASRDPLIVFVHRGFIRKSEHAYNSNPEELNDTKSHITNSRDQSGINHFFGFDELGDVLTQESNFAPNYMNETFMPQVKRISNFIVQAAMSLCIARLKSRFQVYGLDWMLSKDGSAYLLEANMSPSLDKYPSNTRVSPYVIDGMIDLVHRIHVNPKEFGQVDFSVEGKYKYHGWELIYNELEAKSWEPYRACKMNEYVKEKHPLYSYLS
mmetsp:Transcript_12620/g.20393  ORF Transcript_12620/g.20393 Transcript_12620/m.20393 type:complete len:509 (-) Transcript_12620:79-1605(-)